MIKKLRNLLAGLAVLGLSVAPLAVPTVAHAQIQEGLEAGTCLSVDGTLTTDCPSPADAEERINDIIRVVINIFSLIVGLISVIMIIIGGLKYIMSGGAADNVSGAKNTILYAIIGLVVVALAQFVVRFVLGRVTE